MLLFRRESIDNILVIGMSRTLFQVFTMGGIDADILNLSHLFLLLTKAAMLTENLDKVDEINESERQVAGMMISVFIAMGFSMYT